MKFAFIASEKAFKIAFMCRMLEVSRSGYYSWLARPMSDRAVEDDELAPMLHDEFGKTPRGCGSRTLVGALRARGRRVSRRRVTRLMAQERLRHRLKRRFARTTNSRHDEPIAANLLKRAFAPGVPNKVWVGDITYIATKRGWVYLAVLMDLGSRRVVGWNVSPSMEQGVALRALTAAVNDRRPPPGLIHHSDRGSQYAARAYREQLAENGIVCSMSRKANCWDNAVAESFFSTLKRELPNDELPEDWRHVERLVFEYVEAHYNTNRRHSVLGYVSPNEYERQHAA